MNVHSTATVMPGLVPGIHDFPAQQFQDVGGRNECGHDDSVAQRGAC
jgi:hypothetical protein